MTQSENIKESLLKIYFLYKKVHIVLFIYSAEGLVNLSRVQWKKFSADFWTDTWEFCDYDTYLHFFLKHRKFASFSVKFIYLGPLV